MPPGMGVMSTATGLLWLLVSLLPSWPLVPWPQHQAVPSAASPHVWAVLAVRLVSAGVGIIGSWATSAAAGVATPGSIVATSANATSTARRPLPDVGIPRAAPRGSMRSPQIVARDPSPRVRATLVRPFAPQGRHWALASASRTRRSCPPVISVATHGAVTSSTDSHENSNASPAGSQSPVTGTT